MSYTAGATGVVDEIIVAMTTAADTFLRALTP